MPNFKSAILASCWRTKISAWATAAESIGSSPVSLYVYLPDCDKVVEKAVAEGAKILKPVQDQFYGDRSGFIQDPFGHLWGVATHKEDVSEKEMAERAKKVMQAA
jgi:PhnB protein